MTACGQPPLCSWLKAKLFCEAGRTGLAAYFPKPAITAAAMAVNWAAAFLRKKQAPVLKTGAHAPPCRVLLYTPVLGFCFWPAGASPEGVPPVAGMLSFTL